MRRLNSAHVLHVNLTKKDYWTEEYSSEDMQNYLGARGLASLILWKSTKKGIDPLGPENVLIFAPGVLTGTNIPTGGRTTVIGKSPATGMFMKASMGGHWGAELKYTGYDLLVVHGKAVGLTNVIITNSDVKFLDASDFKNLDVIRTTEKLSVETNLPTLEIACIGPSGENLVKFAGIMCNMYHTAARGGLGAVMGSKNLKAIGVYGKNGISLNDVETFLKTAEKARRSIDGTGRCQFYKEYGTAGVVMGTNEAEAFPVKNFQLGSMENAYDISGQCLTEQKYLVRRESCFACSISCKRYTQTKQRYLGTKSGGPEYETLGAFGAGCMVPDMDANLKANELSNLWGLDTISAGAVIQWAMETAEKGLLPDTFQDPLTGKKYKLTWGNEEAMLVLLDMISFRRGLGDLLADGVKIAAEKVGGDAWKWALHAKGLEQSRVETRNAKAYALAFATNPRGPDHLYGQPMAEFGFSPEARALVKKLTGDEKYATPNIIEKKPEIVVWHEECFVMTDCLGVCSRATLSTYAITVEMMADFFEAGTGIKLSEEEFHKAARRVINMERSFNIRVGADGSLDTLAWRIMNEGLPISTGKKEAIVTPKELNIMLDRYYEIRGWDNSGKPTRETLNNLGLQFIEY